MSKSGRNEKQKATVSFLNGVALVLISASLGLIAARLDHLSLGVFAVALAAATLIHVVARAVAGRLDD